MLLIYSVGINLVTEILKYSGKNRLQSDEVISFIEQKKAFSEYNRQSFNRDEFAGQTDRDEFW